MENKTIIQISEMYVAPDGTLLWPHESNCGCKAISTFDFNAEKKFVYVLFSTCHNHYRKICLNNSENVTNFKYFEGDLLPIGTTDDLE